MLGLSQNLKEIDKFPSDARWLLLSVFVSNLGNGIHGIVIGLILYSKTGSISAFGLVMLMEYMMNFLLQMIAGSVVDRYNPKYISIICDLLCAVAIIIASFMIKSEYQVFWIFLATVVITATSPFYKAASFSIAPRMFKGDLLTRYNSLSAGCVQVGQLLGVAFAGVILQYFGTNMAFALNGFSYLIAGYAISRASFKFLNSDEPKHIMTIREFFEDWKEILCILKDNKELTSLLFLSSGDFLAINFINLTLAPIVLTWYEGNQYWLSVFDGSFSIGWIIVGVVGFSIIKFVGKFRIVLAGILAQGFLFLAFFIFKQNPIMIIISVLIFGVANALSMTVYMTTIQEASIGPIKGRISSVRQLLLSIVAACIIPLITSAHDKSILYGLCMSTLFCLILGFIILILGSFKFFKNTFK